jgi:hypothetical protein
VAAQKTLDGYMGDQVEPITCSRRHKVGQLSRMTHLLALLVAHDFTRLKTPKFEADHGAARRLQHVARRGADAKWCFVCDVEVQGHVLGQGQRLLKFFGRRLNKLANELGEV